MSDLTCANCGEHWTKCECWDARDEEDNAHEILALRLKNKLTQSKYLKARED